MRYYNPYVQAVGATVFNWNYGWILAKTARNSGIVDRVVDFVQFMQAHTRYDRAVLIGHSNGCEIAWSVSRRTPLVVGLCLNNAALNADTRFPERLKFVHNWYTPHDKAVWVAKWIPFNRWGGLGAQAYAGVSSNVKNFNKGVGKPHSESHSDTYTNQKLREHFLPRQIAEIQKEVTL